MPGASPNWTTGYVPSAGEWNTLWGNKSDFGNQVQPISNIASLRSCSISTVASSQCYVTGYATNADGGEGLFIANAADTQSADNGGTVIVDASGRRWFRQGAKANALNLAWFGGIADGSTDNVPALNRALAALPSGGGEITCGPGTFSFHSLAVFNYPSGAYTLTLSGAGAQASILYWASSGGLSLGGSNAAHAFHCKDLTFRTGTSGTNTGILMTQASPGGNIQQNDFTRVTFDGTGTNYWSAAISVVGWGNINYDGVLVYANSGTGVSIAGNVGVGFQFSVIHNFAKCGFFGPAIGISYGTYVQGVTISECNFTNGTKGVVQASGAVNGSQLAINNSQFGVTGTGIEIDGAINEVIISGNLFTPDANANGIAWTSAANSSFNAIGNNVFAGSSVTNSGAISCATGTCTDTVVTGNIFQNLTTAVNIGTGTTRWNVQSNHYSNCTSNVVNGGTGNTVGGGSA